MTKPVNQQTSTFHTKFKMKLTLWRHWPSVWSHYWVGLPLKSSYLCEHRAPRFFSCFAGFYLFASFMPIRTKISEVHYLLFGKVAMKLITSITCSFLFRAPLSSIRVVTSDNHQGSVSERRFNKLQVKKLTQSTRKLWVFSFRTGVQSRFNQLWVCWPWVTATITMATPNKWKRSSCSPSVIWLSAETFKRQKQQKRQLMWKKLVSE